MDLSLSMRIRRLGNVFKGPLDDLPATLGAWSIARRLLSSYTGNLIRLRRTSDNAEQDFGFVGNGDLDTAAIATFLSATTGFLTTVYAQDGAVDFTQTTDALQPQYVASGLGSKPSGLYVRTSSLRMRADITEYTGTTLTICHLMQCVSDTGNDSSVTLIDSSDPHDFTSIRSTIASFQDGALQIQVFRGGSLGTLTRPANGTAFQRSVVFDGVNVTTYIDGSASTSDASSGAFAFDRAHWGCRWETQAPSNFYDGHEVELVLFPSALSTADREAFEANQSAYWGTP